MKRRLINTVIAIICYQVLHAQTKPELIVPVGHTASVKSAVFSPDGEYVLTSSEANSVKLWNSINGSLLHSFDGNKAIWSPDGKRIVTLSDGVCKIWNADTYTILFDLEGHSDRIYYVCWSHDSKTLVTSSEDNTARIRDSETGKTIQILEGHTSSVYSIEWSNDGNKIVTTSADNTAKIWDAGNGKLLQSLEGTEVIPLETYYDQYYRPDLWKRVMNREVIK